MSERLLDQALVAAAWEAPGVRRRLEFISGDLLALGNEHGGRYDLVCCHGVAVYLPSLEEVVAALCATVRPGGLVSVLTRNRVGLAMRAGMTGDWAGAASAFDARYYDNRLGIQGCRADDPAEVRALLEAQGASVHAWYGARLFSDHWGAEQPRDDIDELLAVEEQAGRRDPYRTVCALTHTLARR